MRENGVKAKLKERRPNIVPPHFNFGPRPQYRMPTPREEFKEPEPAMPEPPRPCVKPLESAMRPIFVGVRPIDSLPPLNEFNTSISEEVVPAPESKKAANWIEEMKMPIVPSDAKNICAICATRFYPEDEISLGCGHTMHSICIFE